MSSVDELIDAAEKLLEDSMRPAEGEIVGGDELASKTVEGELAEKVLRRTSVQDAFHFHMDAGRPLWVSSDSLVDFCRKMMSVDLRAIEYHFRRGDFEVWIHHLGDNELANTLRLIRGTDMSGEPLRKRLHKAVRSRCVELQKAIASRNHHQSKDTK